MTKIQYSGQPMVLVGADSDAGLERASSWATAVGCRVLPSEGLDALAERLVADVPPDGVVVDVTRDGGAALDALLDQLSAAAAQGWYRSVVAAPIELLDVVAARTSHADIAHLCDPDDLAGIEAVALAVEPQSLRVHDPKGDQLHQISSEMERLAGAIAALSRDREVEVSDAELPVNADFVRRWIRIRRQRDSLFHPPIFGDPAFDILLDLMLARLEQRPVSVSSLCIAAAVPPTTALRWINNLTEHQITVRTCDPRDGRRVLMSLSDTAARVFGNYLATAEQMFAQVIAR